MIAQLAIGVAPHIIRRFAPQIMAQLVKRGVTSGAAKTAIRATQGALTAGQFMTEMGFQEQQQVADLIEKGYSPEEAMAEVRSKPLSTALRASFEPLATQAMLRGKLPNSALVAGGIQALGGAIQGLDSGVNRGYGLGGTLGEVAAGTVLGAVPTAFDYLPNLPYKRFFKPKVQEQ